MLAWHYTTTSQTCRYGDGRDDRGVGTTLIVEGTPVPCHHGLHGSRRLLDAIRYAKSCMVRRVRLGGAIVEQLDKVAAQERTILAEPASAAEADYAHLTYARLAAAEVLQYWPDPPAVVLDWLSTGDPELRAASRAAAGNAWDGAWAADAAAWAAWAARDADAAAWAAWAADAATWADWDARAADADRDRLNSLAEDVIPAILGWDMDEIDGGGA